MTSSFFNYLVVVELVRLRLSVGFIAEAQSFAMLSLRRKFIVHRVTMNFGGRSCNIAKGQDASNRCWRSLLDLVPKYLESSRLVLMSQPGAVSTLCQGQWPRTGVV